MSVLLSRMPSPRAERVIRFTDLSGGLDLFSLEHDLSPKASPEMKNLYWSDGALGCRPGQRALLSADAVPAGKAAYPRLFHGYGVFHAGTGLYACRMADPEPEAVLLRDGLPEQGGNFFRWGGELYYKAPGVYCRVRSGESGLQAEEVPCYVPVTLINTDPESGGGDGYQPENRLSGEQWVWYSAKAGVTDYRLPGGAVDQLLAVEVAGELLSGGYTVDVSEGVLRFDTAPAAPEPFVPNTVKVRFRRDNAGAGNALMSCRHAAVYGAGQELCVVLGGSESQPNAYFWSGSHSGADPGYFPMEQYNLAGDAGQAITGFGRQQGMLVIFQERSVGKATLSTAETGTERLSLNLPYTAISSAVGCDLPGSIQAIGNHLLFANRETGVSLLAGSSAAGENRVEPISGKVNGSAARPGLLVALRRGGSEGVCSFDDGSRYWLAADGEVFVWDYALSGWSDPSWFYFSRIHAGAFFRDGGEGRWHVGSQGGLTVLDKGFSDFGEGIEKVYRFPAQRLDGDGHRCHVRYVLIELRTDTDASTALRYITDLESRDERCPIVSRSWRLAPRNLAHRCLAVPRFAHTARRQPDCRHVRHFAMRLENAAAGEDLSLISAQVIYTRQGRGK